MNKDLEEQQEEEAARKLFKRSEEFIDWVWNRGIIGKAAVTVYLVVMTAPSLFNGYAIFLLWFTFYPVASNLTERLEFFGRIDSTCGCRSTCNSMAH